MSSTPMNRLRLAAKAARLVVHEAHQAQRDACGAAEAGLWIDGGSTCWNPRVNDGDALQLLAVLHVNLLHLSFHSSNGRVEAGIGQHSWVSVPYGRDKAAAVREAIFQVAVMYGAEMAAVEAARAPT